jgi:hypothetical protein
LELSAVSSLNREIPLELEEIEPFKKLVGFRSSEVPSGFMLVSIGSYVLELSKLGKLGTGENFVPSIYQFTYNDEEREMLKLGLVKPNSYARPL